MKTFCFNCEQWEEYSVKEEKEQLIIDGVSVAVEQKHAFCNNCHEEVFPDEISDKNVEIAHDAYREAIGSISIADMRAILEMYDIGARPLSELLGWGTNTIERQMKHTVPEKKYANQLKRLFDPYNMMNIIVKYGDRISDPTRRKVIQATIEQMRKLVSTTTTRVSDTNPVAYKKDDWTLERSSTSTPDYNDKKAFVSAGCSVSFQNTPHVNFCLSSPFNYPGAA